MKGIRFDFQRYCTAGYVKSCPCVQNDAKIWNVFTSLKDVDLQDFLICAVKTNVGIDYYYTILPKKQYFSQGEFVGKLGEIDKFKAEIERFGEKSPRPYMLWSLTHLETYDNLKKKIDQKMGVEIDSDSVWFHKCFGALKDDDLDGMTEQEKAELKKYPVLFDGKVKEVSLDGSVKEVAYDASVEKDAAFNELPLPARLKLLGSIAAHDVLFFGIKS